MVTLLLPACTDAQLSRPHDDVTIARPHFGVYFQPRSDFDVVSESWLHTFSLDLPHRFRFNGNESIARLATDMCQVKAVKSQTEISNCMNFKQVTDTIFRAHKRQAVELQRQTEAIFNILPAVKSPQRLKARSWCNLCTRVFTGITGLAPQGEIDKTNAMIKKLKAEKDAVLNKFAETNEHLQSFMAVQSSQMKSITSIVTNHQAQLEAVLAQHERETTDWQQYIRAYLSLVERAQNFSVQLLDIEVLRLDIIALQHGQLTPNLISLEIMQSVLNNVTEYLERNNISLRLIYPQAMDMYALKQFTFERHDEQLFITVRIPLSPFSEQFHLYKVQVVDLPTPTSDHMTRLTGIPNLVAFNPVDETYFEFDQPPKFDAAHLYFLDRHENMLLHKKTPSCIMALINDKPELVKQLCQVAFKPFILQPKVTVVGRGRLLLRNITNYTLRCSTSSEPRVENGCRNCEIVLPCQCTFESDYGNYVPRLVHCTTDGPTEITKAHIMNMAVLQLFFFSSTAQWSDRFHFASSGGQCLPTKSSGISFSIRRSHRPSKSKSTRSGSDCKYNEKRLESVSVLIA